MLVYGLIIGIHILARHVTLFDARYWEMLYGAHNPHATVITPTPFSGSYMVISLTNIAIDIEKTYCLGFLFKFPFMARVG